MKKRWVLLLILLAIGATAAVRSERAAPLTARAWSAVVGRLKTALGPPVASASPPDTSRGDARPADGERRRQDATFAGVLLPPQMANVSSRTDGKLLNVTVHVGQVVRKGDILARFDTREREQELAMAEGQLRAAKGAAATAGADLGAARGRAARRSATVEVGGQRVALVSGEEATQSVFDARMAAGRVSSALGQIAEHKARINALKLALEESTLRAPFDGVVTGVYAEAGMNVHAKESVVRVVGGGVGLRLRMAIPEEDGRAAHIGNVASVLLEGHRELSAKLTQVSPEVDPLTRTLFVEADVDLGGEDRLTTELAGRAVRAAIKTM